MCTRQLLQMRSDVDQRTRRMGGEWGGVQFRRSCDRVFPIAFTNAAAFMSGHLLQYYNVP